MAIAGTDGRFDLYWIAVAADLQGRGIGREILRRVEGAVAAAGGVRLYVDTATSATYAPTRAFYRRMGFRRTATLPDFFRPGDGKAIYEKDIALPVAKVRRDAATA